VVLIIKKMANSEIAKILYEISQYLEMEDIEFKPRAYEKAGMAIEGLDQNISDIYKKQGLKGLEKIPSIGKGIAEKIEELIKTGKSKYYQQLKKKTPVKLSELTAIEEVGPKTVKKLYKNLGVKNLKDLEKAAKKGKIRNLENFGIKSEENILQGIEFLRKSGGRFLLGFILPEVRKIEQRIKEFPGVKKTALAGSIRRMKETIGDGDLLATVSNPKTAKKVSGFFINMPEVAHVYSHGLTKSSIRLRNNMDFDLRVVPEQSFGAALQYFTGSKAHNIALRKIAMKKGLKLNEYGLFKGKSQIAGKTEEEIYKKLGLSWMEPELRTDTGEIEASKQGKLPKIIGYNELKGDLQMHTTWSDGANSIEEMARGAMKLGLKYIAITDHTKSLPVTGGLDEKGLLKHGREIDKINTRLRKSASARQEKFRILKSAEVEILKDGRLDIRDEILARLDIVGIAVHSNFKMSKKDMTERIIRAMKNPNADILFHPTGRLINQRPPYELDMEKIIRVAKETKTILEINARPNRLDLKDEHARMARQAGVKLSISSDSHSIQHFQYLELGIAQARRGWMEKKDIINTWPVEKMLKMLK
jgi:DNA polymerase (family 10)